MNSTSPEFVSIPLDQIKPSRRNPRKTFDAAALDQLAASITAKGVLEPILVRPRTLWQMVCGFVARQKAIMDADGSSYGLSVGQFEGAGIAFHKSKKKSLYDDVIRMLIEEGRAEKDETINFSWHPGPKALDPVTEPDPLDLGIDHYELIAGERRWRASKIAGQESIPALVRDLSDHDAAEIRVIENDQREDVPPLEQAEGYAELIAMGDDVESIAAKIGRPAKYVTARLTLTKLIPTLQEDVRSGKLPFGHAHLLARLPATSQQAMLNGDSDGFAGDLYERDWGANVERVIPLESLRRELRQFIGKLKDAPWSLDDETLVPTAGSCAKCPKRSGANPTLFDELVKDDTIDLEKKIKPKDLNPDHCTDRDCYAGKKAAFIELQLKKTSEKTGSPVLKVGVNWGTRDGVLGVDRYEESDAKTAKKDPSVKPAVIVQGEHAGKVIYIREKKPTTGRPDPVYAKEEAKRRAKAKAGNVAAAAALARVAHAAKEKVEAAGEWPTPLMMAMREVAKAMALNLWHSDQIRVAKRRGIQTPKGNASPGRLIAAAADNFDTAGECFALICELIAARLSQWWGNRSTTGVNDAENRSFWAAFGVDPEKLVKLAEKGDLVEQPGDNDDDKPAPKAKPKKRKAGAAS